MTRVLGKSPFSLSKSYKVSINVLFKNWYLLGVKKFQATPKKHWFF